MTTKEIIETLEIAKAEVEWNYPLDYAIAFDEAVKILEKEIPIKIHKMVKFENIVFGRCRCGHDVASFMCYCENCGQKIDWSDDNE